jgi:hypothetical protein
VKDSGPRKRMVDSIDAFKYYIDSIRFPQVIIIDVAMPEIFTKKQFEMAYCCIRKHQKETLSVFGWIGSTGKFLLKNITETYEPVNKQGKDFIRYIAIRR